MMYKIYFVFTYIRVYQCYCIYIDEQLAFINSLHLNQTGTLRLIFVCLMVFNAIFNTISVIYRGGQLYLWRKPEDPEKTTDLSQVTDKRSCGTVARMGPCAVLLISADHRFLWSANIKTKTKTKQKQKQKSKGLKSYGSAAMTNFIT